MLQIINKEGKSGGVVNGLCVKKTEDEISFLIMESKAVYESLEQQGVELATGEYFEHTIMTKSHYIESSVIDGGGQSALMEGQILVHFEY